MTITEARIWRSSLTTNGRSTRAPMASAPSTTLPHATSGTSRSSGGMGRNSAAWRHVARPVSRARDSRPRWASMATSRIGSIRALATLGSREK